MRCAQKTHILDLLFAACVIRGFQLGWWTFRDPVRR